MPGFIYLITHLASGRYYVGQTTMINPSRRWVIHKSSGRHAPVCVIDRAIGKHGPDAFIFETIGQAESQDALDTLEKIWILLLASNRRGIGFNIRGGGGGGGPHSQATKDKLRLALMGKRLPDESYKRGADKRRGIKQRPEWTEKIRNSQKGRSLSPQHLENLRAGQKRKALNPEWQRQNRAKLDRINSDPFHQERNRAHLARLNNDLREARDARLSN